MYIKTHEDGRPFCGCTECDKSSCTELCRQEWYMEKRRRVNLQKHLHKILTMPLRVCRVCGRLYLPKTGNQKYCIPKCSHHARKLRVTDYSVKFK